MAGCSLLFMVVYGGTTWITAHRGDVGVWYYDWELRIPFLPWMIVPYWSIDLFFLGSFFTCANRAELNTLGKRIALAILAAGTCFLLFPLRTAFPRPEVEGAFGWMFGALRAFDQPYNLVPSLHIALRTILADTYARHTSGPLRIVVHGWFALIGFSTVFTYQHQIVDVIGGFLLAIVCFYAFREEREVLPVVPNPRIGIYYALGAFILVVLAAGFGSWVSWLLWPAASLGIVASAYFGIGPTIFRKTNGRLPMSTWLMLWPYLLGQQLSLLHYKRQCRPWDEIVPGVWIGRRLSNVEAAEAGRQGVTAVLDLTAEFSEAAPFRALSYRNLALLDLTAPTTEQLRDSTAFLREHAGRSAVYVHCKIGYSRSAVVVGAFLLATGHAKTSEDAIALMRSARPSLVVRPEALEALREYEKTLHLRP